MDIKTGEIERRQVALELKERQTQVKHLKNRFHVLINRLHGDEEDAENEATHAQYIVKAAKEREELQARGDKLDEEIKKMEREAKKLDKTIAMLKHCNHNFKGQFKRAAGADPEAVTKGQLETKNREVQSVVNRRATDLKQYLKNEMNKMAELQDVSREHQELTHKINILREGMDGVNKHITDYRNVISKVDSQLKTLRAKVDPDLNRDVLFYSEKERLNQVLVALSAYSSGSSEPNLASILAERLGEHGIEVPRPSSARSVASSRASSTG
eukprot:NODE_997_length_1515_cov_49.582853_g986_i0.p1 GENE.NODE_997_length_1515_cov_49.582853_g986_i0~~NODE_997_length_1515_cov_49.582853_g986_i0.p1  ORF type:complete len:271 (+),score=70.60 NODE_997_length_1515_cov_49.582853_g986_i0:478-1290(+)